jgi:UDP-2-acetamido-3-amino-2,3-dideoxy-glucuronate N-acetyltransferase
MTSKISIGLAGLGYWGKNILRNLHELGVLHSACDADENTIAAHKKNYPAVSFTTKFTDLLEARELQAIAIAAPAVAHYAMVKKALQAGKDVYVEKPLSLTVRESQELVDIAEKEGRILMVGHILQYHPAVLKLKEMIDAGELGKVEYIYSNRLSIGKLRTEENILWSFAPHDISVILMLLEEEPVSVNSFGGAYLTKDIYDTTMTTLEFKNGVKGHIFVSWLHPFKEQKLVVVGSRAMAVFDDVSKEKLFLYPHKIDWKEGKMPVAHKAEHQLIPIEKAEPLKAELEHFIDCIRTRRTPRTDGREGLRVLKVLDLAEHSLAGEAPYSSPLTPHSSPLTPHSSSVTPDVFVHESAIVDDGVSIGPGTKIWHFSHVLKGTKTGNRCIIGQNCVIGPDVTIGNRCKVQNNVSLYKGVTLEDEVFCGPSSVFTNVYNPRAFIERKLEFLPTLVKRGATIGANATIVCGTTIGRYALIGAGAVVKKDVDDYAVVAGVPAKQIGWACKCGTTLKFIKNKAKCSYCGNKYSLKDGKFTTDEHR